MSVDGVRPVKVVGVPLIEVVYRLGKHPSLILTRHDIVARIGSQLHHPRLLACFQHELYGYAHVNRKRP
jgi:hypothetical protein